MAVHGKGTKVYFGNYDLTQFCDSADASQSLEPAETTCFGNGAKTYIPGLRDGTASLSGKADYSAGAVDEALVAAMDGSSRVLTLGLGGGAFGDRVRMASIRQTGYNQSVPVGDVVSWTADLQADGGIDAGVILRALAAATGTLNGASVDNGAASTNGYSAHIHVTVDNVTSVTVKIQHSPDDSTWADLATFTAVSAVSSERLTGTGTVDQYVRMIISAFTGTTFTLVVAFARK